MKETMLLAVREQMQDAAPGDRQEFALMLADLEKLPEDMMATMRGRAQSGNARADGGVGLPG